MKLAQPDEIYNLAAQSHVRISFDVPEFTIKTNALGVLNMLESLERIVLIQNFIKRLHRKCLVDQ